MIVFQNGHLLSEEEAKDSTANIERLLESRFGIPIEFILVTPWHSLREEFLETMKLESDPTIEIHEDE